MHESDACCASKAHSHLLTSNACSQPVPVLLCDAAAQVQAAQNPNEVTPQYFGSDSYCGGQRHIRDCQRRSFRSTRASLSREWSIRMSRLPQRGDLRYPCDIRRHQYMRRRLGRLDARTIYKDTLVQGWRTTNCHLMKHWVPAQNGRCVLKRSVHLLQCACEVVLDCSSVPFHVLHQGLHTAARWLEVNPLPSAETPNGASVRPPARPRL